MLATGPRTVRPSAVRPALPVLRPRAPGAHTTRARTIEAPCTCFHPTPEAQRASRGARAAQTGGRGG
eukprot:COSAG01_NODE_2110_length_8408_cov_19.542183_9_plen_67_part_00